MPGHNTDQRQRDRGHNDGWRRKVAKFPNHKDVDHDQRDTECDTHVTEGHIRNRPLTRPFQRRLQAVSRWASVIRTNTHTVRRNVFVQQIFDLEQGIDRRAKAACNFTRYVLNCTQVFVIHRIVHQERLKTAQFCQRDHSSIGCRNWQLAKTTKLAAQRKRHLQDDEPRL